jgi:hypothetical protein
MIESIGTKDGSYEKWESYMVRGKIRIPKFLV